MLRAYIGSIHVDNDTTTLVITVVAVADADDADVLVLLPTCSTHRARTTTSHACLLLLDDRTIGWCLRRGGPTEKRQQTKTHLRGPDPPPAARSASWVPGGSGPPPEPPDRLHGGSGPPPPADQV
eukprot:1189731-Prorocentrum_minimum.AAC.1